MGNGPCAPGVSGGGLVPARRRLRDRRRHALSAIVTACGRACVLALSLALAAVLLAAGPAWAGPFPLEETFTHTGAGAHWVLGGSATLTGSKEAEGWLRLTPAETGRFGYAYDNEAFPSNAGALVEFEYADWGGSGADGLTFFLFNGSTSEAEFHPGQSGGSLGYAPCNSLGNGLSNAYVGVGFDEYGNFTNLKTICGLDGESFIPNHVTIRGSQAEAYKLLATASTTESLRAERSQARRVTMSITPAGKLSVYIRFPDGTYQAVTQGFQLPAAPATLKFGYVASTGALTDNHEIRQAKVVKPTQLTPTISQTGGGHQRGEPLTWTAVVRNEGPNASQQGSIRTSVGEQPIAGVAWTCEAAGGATCQTSTGTGLPDLNSGAMPEGSTLTYKITGTPTAAASYAQMTVEAEPSGEAGELDPEKDKATATTTLAPLFNREPSFTLASSGLATAAPGNALGVGVTYAYQWQRCQPGGTSCVNIAGAQATTYQTTAADREHTIRLTQTATDSAGSVVADSPPYAPLPVTTITTAPASYVSSAEASFSFASSTSGATFECARDHGAWSACVSPKSYTGLSGGTHSFEVRAIYGGLNGQPTPAAWTVELTPPHAPTIVSSPPSRSSQRDPTFKFGALEPGDTLECHVDSNAWAPCGATTELTGLADGSHRLEVRQVGRASLRSTAASYAWKIESKVPPAPVATSAPEAETTQTSARFEFSHEPEATLECSLDGKPYVKCTAGMTVSELTEGAHTLAARQVSPTGVVSSVTTVHWHVGPKAAAQPATASKSPAGHKTPKHKRSAKRKVKAHARKKPRKSSHKRAPAKPKTRPAKPVTKPAPAQPKAQPTPEPAPAAKARPKSEAEPKPKPKPAGEPKAKPHPKPGTEPKPRTEPKAKAPPQPSSERRPKAHPTTEPKPRSGSGTPAHGAEPARPQARSGEGVPSEATPAPKSKPRSKPRPTTKPGSGTTSETTAKHEPTTGKRAKSKTGSPPQTAHEPASSGKARSAPQPASSPPTGKSPSGTARTKGAPALPLIRPFAAGSWALVAQARRLVQKVALALQGAHVVMCIGYTDSSGGGAGNLAIGLRRAQAVCAALRALGVHAKLKLESGGATRPLATNTTAAGRQQNRRVEVRIVS